jgi:hypothetical protein
MPQLKTAIIRLDLGGVFYQFIAADEFNANSWLLYLRLVGTERGFHFFPENFEAKGLIFSPWFSIKGN